MLSLSPVKRLFLPAAAAQPSPVPLRLSRNCAEPPGASDLLTGLLSRSGFHAELARRGQGAGTIAVLDCDRFKLVNELLGSEEGDRILRAIAVRLGALRSIGAVLARWGGDSFAVFLPEDRAAEGQALIAAVMQSLASRRLAMIDDTPVGLRCGYARVAAACPLQVEAAIREADEEIYAAKCIAVRRYA